LVAHDLKIANDFAVGIGEERACHPIIKLCSRKIAGVLNRLRTLVPNRLRKESGALNLVMGSAPEIWGVKQVNT